jgi:ubiquinone biosynthesis protein UbiJ
MGPRSGGRSRASNGRTGATRDDQQYDLLTAAVLGLVAGAGIAFLLRGRRKRGASALAREAGALAGAAAGRAGRRGARWAARRGEELIDRIPVDEITDSLGEYVQTAREAIDDTVTHELNDLRKAIRRHRKRLGI